LSDTQLSYHQYANKKKRLVNSLGNGYTGVNHIKSGCAFWLIARLLIARLLIGSSTTFNGLNGCFYMLQAGVPTSFADERVANKLDATGN
jgi:hypothetical protein